MGLVIKKNVKNIQNQYIDSIVKFFTTNKFSYSYDGALNIALDIYEKMKKSLNGLVGSISTRYSQFANFHKGYPIHDFKTSNSTWYFAYKINENTGNVIVFDMQNSNQNQGKT